VSTEWIVLVWFIKYVVIIITTKGVYVRIIRLTARRYIFEGGNTVPHEDVYIRKTNLENARNHGYSTKRISELYEKAINSMKKLQSNLFFRRR